MNAMQQLQTSRLILLHLMEITNQLEIDKSDLEKQLAKVDSIKKAFHQRKALQETKLNTQREINEIREQIAGRINETWWAPATGWLKSKSQEIETATNRG
ncbi:MAG: hypothetical protein FJW91_06145 [Actinobacteria bacterium]|nr:hypothetical protein [Actinomycetota bacterium]